MTKPRNDQEEKALEKLAKKLLSTPHKPREESKESKRKPNKKKQARPAKVKLAGER